MVDRTIRLYIDDVRDMPEGFNFKVENYEDAIEILETYEVTAISFDHDLGLAKSGYDIACWIEKEATRGLPRMEWYVHSANPVGVKRIEAAMKAADSYWSAVDSVIRRHELFNIALKIFKNTESALEFFRIRHPELGDETPFQLIMDNNTLELKAFIEKVVDNVASR